MWRSDEVLQILHSACDFVQDDNVGSVQDDKDGFDQDDKCGGFDQDDNVGSAWDEITDRERLVFVIR